MTLAGSGARLRHRLFRSAAYNLTLRPDQAEPLVRLAILFPGHAARGRAPAEKRAPGRHVDRFRWLAELEASGLEVAAKAARERTAAWVDAHARWDPVSWKLDILAERLGFWLLFAPFLCDDSEPAFSALYLASLHRQSRHLRQAVWLGELVDDGFAVAKALLLSAICLPKSAAPEAVGLDHLEARTGLEILPDGGHRSRNPAIQLGALRNLVEIREHMSRSGRGVPLWLQTAIDRMAPMVRTFRHGDGALCQFNGSTPATAYEVDRVLECAEARGRAVANAPHCGFQRLLAGKTLVILDAGTPVSDTEGLNGHAGTLSFEMSSARRRVIVNCGIPVKEASALGAFCRGSAAHSTLIVANTNSSELLSAGLIGARRARRMETTRTEIDKNIVVESEHDGYVGPFGLLHKRVLYLAADGSDLRGEDTLRGPGTQQGAVRFHLHPDVQASRIEGGRSLLLRVGKTQGWRFRTSGPEIELEESLYFGDGERRQSEQIVVPVIHQGPVTVIKWRFQRAR